MIYDVYKPYPGWTSRAISLAVSTQDDLDDAFVKFEQEQAELLAVAARGDRVAQHLDQVAEEARRRRLPTVCDSDDFARKGGLMSHAVDGTTQYRGVGRFIDKILKGASPADLPVELPSTFNFVINKATAGAIGLTIPPAVLAQATEVRQ